MQYWIGIIALGPVKRLGIECAYEIKNFGPDDQLEEKLFAINTNERRNLNRYQKIVIVLKKKRIAEGRSPSHSLV